MRQRERERDRERQTENADTIANCVSEISPWQKHDQSKNYWAACYSWRRREWWRLRGPLPVALAGDDGWLGRAIFRALCRGAGVRFSFGKFWFFSLSPYLLLRATAPFYFAFQPQANRSSFAAKWVTRRFVEQSRGMVRGCGGAEVRLSARYQKRLALLPPSLSIGCLAFIWRANESGYVRQFGAGILPELGRACEARSAIVIA